MGKDIENSDKGGMGDSKGVAQGQAIRGPWAKEDNVNGKK